MAQNNGIVGRKIAFQTSPRRRAKRPSAKARKDRLLKSSVENIELSFASGCYKALPDKGGTSVSRKRDATGKRVRFSSSSKTRPLQGRTEARGLS